MYCIASHVYFLENANFFAAAKSKVHTCDIFVVNIFNLIALFCLNKSSLVPNDSRRGESLSDVVTAELCPEHQEIAGVLSYRLEKMTTWWTGVHDIRLLRLLLSTGCDPMMVYQSRRNLIEEIEIYRCRIEDIKSPFAFFTRIKSILNLMDRPFIPKPVMLNFPAKAMKSSETSQQVTSNTTTARPVSSETTVSAGAILAPSTKEDLAKAGSAAPSSGRKANVTKTTAKASAVSAPGRKTQQLSLMASFTKSKLNVLDVHEKQRIRDDVSSAISTALSSFSTRKEAGDDIEEESNSEKQKPLVEQSPSSVLIEID